MNQKSFVLFCLLSSPFAVLTQTLTTPAMAQSRSLKTVMKEMGKKLGGIARPVTQGTAGEAEANLAASLLVLAEEAALILPDVVLNASSPERGRLELRYKSLMNDLHVALDELERSIRSGNMSAAQTALQNLLTIRGAGHDEFRL